MWQTIIVLIIGIVVVGVLCYRVYQFFTKPVNPFGCCSECSMKEDKKTQGSSSCCSCSSEESKEL